MKLTDTRTGHDVHEMGDYVNDCCLVELTLMEDRLFPRCPQCLRLCVWENLGVPAEKAA